MTDTLTADTPIDDHEQRKADAETKRRAAYVRGLRILADNLELNPALPLPYDGTASALSVFVDTKTELQAYARLLGKAEKQVDGSVYGFQLTGAVDGLRVLVYARREEVCERVVRGTREETREVPDPEALAAVPTVTVTETVEDVEWICRPILAPDTQAVPA